MVSISAKADIADAKHGLESLGSELAVADRYILRSLGLAAKKWVKKRIYSFLNKRTGKTVSIYANVRKGTIAVVSANPVRIAETLESGATIKPRKHAFLTFRGDEHWVRARQINIPAKHFFSRAEAGFEGSSEYAQAINVGLSRAIKRAGMK